MSRAQDYREERFLNSPWMETADVDKLMEAFAAARCAQVEAELAQAKEENERLLNTYALQEGSVQEYRLHCAESEVTKLREALRQLPQVAQDWSNNLASEWIASRQKVRIFGDPEYQHTDKMICLSDEAKKYAAEITAIIHLVLTDKVNEALTPSREADNDTRTGA
jgi:ribosome-binding ATPase YchF (GTP1/OBG family)